MTSKAISLEARIAEIPRQNICDGFTKMTRLDQLSEDMGIELWMKRDDEAGPSFGGNKSRQLEYYFGAAVAQNADTILITGAVQSNFVRLAAAIANRFKMKAIVQLEERIKDPDQLYRSSGNVLLNQLLGAEILYYPDGEDEEGADAVLYERANALRRQGKNPYVIPLSGNKPPLGALGYVQCAKEIMDQSSQAFDHVVVGTGSGATHLGLTAGMKYYCPSAQVTGSCVRRPKGEQQQRLSRLANQFNEMVEQPEYLTDSDFNIWDGAFLPGYGKLSDKAAAALIKMARSEGYILDPVYTAKSFAAVPGLLEEGFINKGSRVLFVHTGGLGAFFSYQNELISFLDSGRYKHK